MGAGSAQPGHEGATRRLGRSAIDRGSRGRTSPRILSDGFDPDVVAGKQKPQILGVRGEHDHEHRQGKSGGGHYRIDRQVAMLAAGCRSGRPQPA